MVGIKAKVTEVMRRVSGFIRMTFVCPAKRAKASVLIGR
jgi:hypothetical protein